MQLLPVSLYNFCTHSFVGWRQETQGFRWLIAILNLNYIKSKLEMMAKMHNSIYSVEAIFLFIKKSITEGLIKYQQVHKLGVQK